MALRANATLEAFKNKIITNEQIMSKLNLPTIYETDDEKIKKRKMKVLIDKFISKTAQVPYDLGDNFPKVEINGIEYSEYGKIRITVSFAQSIKLDSDIFGHPQVDINIFYDNTNLDNVYEVLDLISDEFSGQDLEIDIGDGKKITKNIRCEVITSSVAIINNYERIGLRFSFYATAYKN